MKTDKITRPTSRHITGVVSCERRDVSYLLQIAGSIDQLAMASPWHTGLATFTEPSIQNRPTSSQLKPSRSSPQNHSPPGPFNPTPSSPSTPPYPYSPSPQHHSESRPPTPPAPPPDPAYSRPSHCHPFARRYPPSRVRAAHRCRRRRSYPRRLPSRRWWRCRLRC